LKFIHTPPECNAQVGRSAESLVRDERPMRSHITPNDPMLVPPALSFRSELCAERMRSVDPGLISERNKRPQQNTVAKHMTCELGGKLSNAHESVNRFPKAIKAAFEVPFLNVKTTILNFTRESSNWRPASHPLTTHKLHGSDDDSAQRTIKSMRITAPWHTRSMRPRPPETVHVARDVLPRTFKMRRRSVREEGAHFV
jgi:hypothetical protein